MSLTPAFKFITVVESKSACPQVLSVGQIFRALCLLIFFAAGMVLYSLSFFEAFHSN